MRKGKRRNKRPMLCKWLENNSGTPLQFLSKRALCRSTIAKRFPDLKRNSECFSTMMQPLNKNMDIRERKERELQQAVTKKAEILIPEVETLDPDEYNALYPPKFTEQQPPKFPMTYNPQDWHDDFDDTRAALKLTELDEALLDKKLTPSRKYAYVRLLKQSMKCIRKRKRSQKQRRKQKRKSNQPKPSTEDQEPILKNKERSDCNNNITPNNTHKHLIMLHLDPNRQNARVIVTKMSPGTELSLGIKVLSHKSSNCKQTLQTETR